jgi:hypothetical protein
MFEVALVPIKTIQDANNLTIGKWELLHQKITEINDTIFLQCGFCMYHLTNNPTEDKCNTCKIKTPSIYNLCDIIFKGTKDDHGLTYLIEYMITLIEHTQNVINKYPITEEFKKIRDDET